MDHHYKGYRGHSQEERYPREVHSSSLDNYQRWNERYHSRDDRQRSSRGRDIDDSFTRQVKRERSRSNDRNHHRRSNSRIDDSGASGSRFSPLRNSKSPSPQHVKREDIEYDWRDRNRAHSSKKSFCSNNRQNNGYEEERIAREPKNEAKYSPDSHRSTGYVPNGHYNKEELESLRTFYCKLCDVKLHDPDSMKGHIDGFKHLTKKNDKKIRASNRSKRRDSTQEVEVDPDFWIKKEQESKSDLFDEAEFKMTYDDERLVKMQSKFDRRNYDHGQFTNKNIFSNDLYCRVCGVSTPTRDGMQAHEMGKIHQRNIAKVIKYECKLCKVEVPCQGTLDSHMKGAGHIKRAAEVMQRKQFNGDKKILTSSEVKNLEQLKKEREHLRSKNKEQMSQLNVCRSSHLEIERINKEYDEIEKELHQVEAQNKQLKSDISKQKKIKKEKIAKIENREYVENNHSTMVETITLD